MKQGRLGLLLVGYIYVVTRHMVLGLLPPTTAAAEISAAGVGLYLSGELSNVSYITAPNVLVYVFRLH